MKELVKEAAAEAYNDDWKMQKKDLWGSGVSMVAPTTASVVYTSEQLFPRT